MSNRDEPAIVQRIVRQLCAACRTNELQATTVIMLAALNGVALLQRTHETPWWFAVAVMAFWPVFAFATNLIDPIPDDDD